MRRWRVAVNYLKKSGRYHCDISPMFYGGAVAFKETDTFAGMIPILWGFGYDDDSIAFARHEVETTGVSTQLNVDMSEDAAKTFGWVDAN